MPLTLRSTKGSALTHAELDGNFSMFVRNDTANNMTGNFGVTGTITATGNITAWGTVSDITLKENLVEIDSPLDKVKNLNGYYFNYKDDSRRLIGVVAQELEQVLPELVYEFNPVGTTDVKKAVKYELLSALLIEALKELNEKVEKLEKELEILKHKQT